MREENLDCEGFAEVLCTGVHCSLLASLENDLPLHELLEPHAAVATATVHATAIAGNMLVCGKEELLDDPLPKFWTV